MISINLKLPVRGPQGANIFTNMSFFGFFLMSEVELCMFHFINIHGFDFQQILNRHFAIDGNTHTHTNTQWPTFLSWTGPTKNSSPSIHLWFGRGYKGWIHIHRQIHGHAHQWSMDRGLKWVQLCSQMCFWVLWLQIGFHFVRVCASLNQETYSA